MNRRVQFALAILCLGAALLFFELAQRRQGAKTPLPAMADSTGSPTQQAKGPAPGPSAGTGPLLSGSSTVSADALSVAPPMKPTAPAVAAPVPATPESQSLPPATILQNMDRTIHQYASIFGENPVGTNPEITSALQGDNPKHLNLLKPDGNRVNAQGELVDAWGTPYFFHQISGHEMEIRSAGPDKVMYTGDDLMAR